MGASQRYNTGYNQQLNGQLGYTGYQPQGSMGGQTGYHNPPQNYANPPRGNTMSGQPVQGHACGRADGLSAAIRDESAVSAAHRADEPDAAERAGAGAGAM